MGYFNPQKIEQDIRPNPANGTVNIGWKLKNNPTIRFNSPEGGVGTMDLLEQ